MRITDYYVASDAMGSVTAILDEDGNLLERRSYDAFGAMTCMAPDGISDPTSHASWTNDPFGPITTTSTWTVIFPR
jgi:hypothetical protein